MLPNSLYETVPAAQAGFAHMRLAGSQAAYWGSKNTETEEVESFRQAEDLTPSPTVLLTCCGILTKIHTSSFSQAMLFRLARGTHGSR